MKNSELILKQQKLNEKLATLFKENGIKNFRLTSFGNSIATGYSMVRTIKPLLLRNESLQQTMEEKGINLDIHHFARAQNNNDEHLYEWLINNISEIEINRMNINDYSGKKTSMPSQGITEEKIKEYYPTTPEKDFKLQDVVLESNDDMANIVIYNGCTGSFLDNVTRNGKLRNMLMHGIKRDTYSLEAILKFIQINNRKKGSNTQVYICGAPNFLGLNIAELINKKLKKIAKKYANVVYVQPVKSKFFYKSLDIPKETNLEQAQSIFRKYLRYPDIHYDEEEYLEFNNNIIQAIEDNYLITNSMIKIDRAFYKFSANIEFENQWLLNDNMAIKEKITEIISEKTPNNLDDDSKEKFYNKAMQYLLDRLPYDFYYISKENIKESLGSKKGSK